MAAIVVGSFSLAAQTIVVPSPTAVAAGRDGSVFLAGSAQNAVPTTPGVFLPGPPPACPATTANCSHAWVAKVANDRVEWSSYVIATADDSATAIAVAPDGNIYVAGIATVGSQRRLFLRKLSPDGKSVLASTTFGGSGQDAISRIAIDPAGNVYVAGTTSSADFPTTPGAFQRTLGAMPPPEPQICSENTDQFAMKFDAALATTVFSTLIGSPAAERADDLAIGADGSVYVAGTRPPDRNSPCTAAILTRLDSRGSAAIYSLSLPAARGYAVTVDPVGNAYLATDNRPFGFATPNGAVFQISPQGAVVGTGRINGLIQALFYADGAIGVLGWAMPLYLAPLNGPGVCHSHLRYDTLSTPYFARLNESTLTATYVGYLNADFAWMAAADRIVATNPYSTLATYAVLPAAPTPPGTVTCVASAATFEPEAVSPGELVSIFGKEIAADRVTVNGLPAPLLYASASQINIVTPFGVSGERARIELYRGGLLVTRFDKRLAPYHPGIFATGRPFTGQLAALNQDGSVNSASNPAAAGSIVTIFATGLGAMTPQLADGAIATEPVNAPVNQFNVLVNDAPAEIRYIGNAPYLVQGVVQINLRLPATATGQPFVGIALPEFPGAGTVAGGTIAVR